MTERITEVLTGLAKEIPALGSFTQEVTDDELISVLLEIEETGRASGIPVQRLRAVLLREPAWQEALSMVQIAALPDLMLTLAEAEASCLQLLWQSLLVTELAERSSLGKTRPRLASAAKRRFKAG